MNSIIKNNYLFLGYIEFGNYIEKVMKIEKEGLTKKKKTPEKEIGTCIQESAYCY